jgi:chromosome segregation ATPase
MTADDVQLYLQGLTARTVADQSQIASLGAQVLDQADTINHLQTKLSGARDELATLQVRADHLCDALRSALEAQVIAADGPVPDLPDRSSLETRTNTDVAHEIAALRAAVADEVAVRHRSELAQLREELSARDREATSLRDIIKLRESEVAALVLAKKELHGALTKTRTQLVSLKAMVPMHAQAHFDA